MARDSDGAPVLVYENRNANRRSRESGLIPGINPEAVPPPGRTLRLSWPLTPDVFTGTATRRPANDHGHPGAEDPDLPASSGSDRRDLSSSGGYLESSSDNAW